MASIKSVEQATQAGQYDAQYGEGAYKALPQAPIVPMASTASSVTDTPIQASILKAQTGTYTPPVSSSNISNTTASVDATIANGQSNKDTQTTSTVGNTQTTTSSQPTNVKQTIQDQIFKILGKEQNIAADKQTIREQNDIAIKEKASRDLSNEILARKQSYTKQIEEVQKNTEGKFPGAVQAAVNDLQVKANRELADLSIQYNIANGDYQAAQQISEEQIADLNASYDNQIKTLQTAYDFLQNDMTESEKVQAQQQFQTKEQERANEEYRLRAQFDQKLKQADPLYQAQIASANRANQSDVVGGGVVSPLSLAKAQGDIQQTTELGKGGGSAIGTSFITRTPGGFWSNVGKFLTGAATGAAVGGTAGLAVGGLGAIPGAIIGGIVGGSVASGKDAYSKLSGSQANFISGVEQLRSNLTLNTLINAKANGATFGALSEGELNLLRDSGTKLSQWAITDNGKPDGKVIGYNTTEANFRKELDKINNYAKLDYLLKGGKPEDVAVVVHPDGTYWTKNNDGSFTQLR